MALCRRFMPEPRPSCTETEQEHRLWEGEQRALHNQGLQRIWASINQLRKESEEFAYPPASVRGREGRWGNWDQDGEGGGLWICSQELSQGREMRWEEGDFFYIENSAETDAVMLLRKRIKHYQDGLQSISDRWCLFYHKQKSNFNLMVPFPWQNC